MLQPKVRTSFGCPVCTHNYASEEEALKHIEECHPTILGCMGVNYVIHHKPPQKVLVELSNGSWVIYSFDRILPFTEAVSLDPFVNNIL